ncbi:hypothetical protein D3C76_1288700 [compost metagenome]
MVALITATSNEVAMAIRPTCKVTPTAWKNAGKVLSMNAVSKVMAGASTRGCRGTALESFPVGARVTRRRCRSNQGVQVSTLGRL